LKQDYPPPLQQGRDGGEWERSQTQVQQNQLFPTENTFAGWEWVVNCSVIH